MSISKPFVLALFITLFLAYTSFFVYYENDIEILKSPKMWSDILQHNKYPKNEINQTILKRKSYGLLSNLSSISPAVNGDMATQNDSELTSIPSIENELLHAILPGKEKGKKHRKIRYILYWNEADGSTKYGFCCGTTPFLDCPLKDCFVTDDRSVLQGVEDFDAIQFHPRSLTSYDLPKKRSPHQRYIMWYMESASYPFGFQSFKWNNFFNWTITYREYSDFRAPYGMIKQIKDHPLEGELLDAQIKSYGIEHAGASKHKTKVIAWFVSNCNSKSGREEYVKELQKYISVDIYGKCGPSINPLRSYTCSKDYKNNCWNIVDRDYYFYLSFENSLCKDYITEKFFNAMKRNVIPVVLGGAMDDKNSSDYRKGVGAPPHSFINAREYSNPKMLADYLHSLISSPELYARYFWWKRYYNITHVPALPVVPMFPYCDICQRLHDAPGEDENNRKVIGDLPYFWEEKSNCQNVRSLQPEKFFSLIIITVSIYFIVVCIINKKRNRIQR